MSINFFNKEDKDEEKDCADKSNNDGNEIYKDKYFEERKKMIKRQIERRGITEKKVLKALLEVPRHEFVPEKLQKNAYDDRPLPIGEGQTISQPYIVAEMIAALEPDHKNKVLEIGSGSGYAAAILSRIVNKVYCVERVKELALKAEKTLNDLGYKNIEVNVGDGTKGWPETVPYDGILVSAAAPEIPDVLLEQLSEDGCLVIPAGDRGVQKLLQVKKVEGDEIKKKNLGMVRFVPLVGEEGWDEE